MTAEEELATQVRLREALARLADIGPVSEIIEHGAVEGAEAAGLDRLLLSRIADRALVPEALHVAAGDGAERLAELRRAPPLLEYPLLEAELVRRRRAELVRDLDAGHPARYAFLAGMGWTAYVAAPVVVDGQAVGLLQGDRATPPLTADVAAALEQFAAGFALLVERAVLRQRLRAQRQEIRRIATWAEVRTSELSDGIIDLSIDRAAESEQRGLDSAAPVDGPIAHLTAREHDVLRLMAAGKTNGEIARALVVTEGTVKFHVKNVLRKMQAANRADATSRYLRVTLGRDESHR